MHDTFEGEVETRWLTKRNGDRDMELLSEFVYIDRFGWRWIAPAGARINGASIPRFFWRIAGSPYCGDYRRASVIHDVACSDRSRPAPVVHLMFFEAMLADGTAWWRAWLMFTAVKMFGPKWRRS